MCVCWLEGENYPRFLRHALHGVGGALLPGFRLESKRPVDKNDERNREILRHCFLFAGVYVSVCVHVKRKIIRCSTCL